jgi:hypothetical protein
MAERPELNGGFVIGPDGEHQNVFVSLNGPDTYIANNEGQSEDEFWQKGQHNHYRTDGWDDVGGADRGRYTEPGA